MPGHCITQFSFGGKALCIDDLCTWSPCPPRAEDLDGDRTIGVSDLHTLLAERDGAGEADPNDDGTINAADLLQLTTASDAG
jgi:hypothetical protein